MQFSVNEALNEALKKAFELRFMQPHKAIELSESVLQSALPQSAEEAYANAFKAYGNFLTGQQGDLKGQLLKAKSYFEENRDSRGLSLVFFYLSQLAQNSGNFPLSISYGLTGIQHAEENNFAIALADLHSSLGNTYTATSDYVRAEEHFLKALEIREQLQEPLAIASSLNLLGKMKSLSGDHSSSIDYYQRSIKLRESIEEKPGLSWSFMGIATAYSNAGDSENAMSYFLKALDLKRQQAPNHGLVHVLSGLAEVLIRKGKYREAVGPLEEAITICEKLKAKALMAQCFIKLAEAYEQMDQLKESLNALRKAQEIKEEIQKEENENKIKNLRAEFELEQSRRESEIEKKKNEELQKAYGEIAEKNKEINESIRYAYRIQNAMLPDGGILKNILPESFILLKPRDVVSGDFYWLSPSPNLSPKGRGEDKGKGGVILAACDCTGHGVPGALMSMIGNNLLNQIIKEKGITEPAEILALMNKGVRDALKQYGDSDSKDGMEVGICHIQLPSPGGEGPVVRLSYAGAGRSLLYVKDGELNEIKPNKTSIGGNIRDGEEFTFAQHELELSKDDGLYMFSDGFPDQFGGEKDKKFSTKRLKDLVTSLYPLPMEQQATLFNDHFEKWKEGKEQTDDVLLMGVKI